MPKAVIDQVNQFAIEQPTLLTFTDRNGHEIGNADQTYEPATKLKIPGVVMETAQITGVEPEAMNAVDSRETDLSATLTSPIIKAVEEQQLTKFEHHTEF